MPMLATDCRIVRWLLLLLTAACPQPASADLDILEQPTSVSVSECSPLSLNVAVSGDPPLTYQWLKNDDSVNGATNSTLSIPVARGLDGGRYFVVVGSPTATLTSVVATAKIIYDLSHTQLLGARGGPDLRTVIVSFHVAGRGCSSTERGLDPATAAKPFNYSLSDGLMVVAAELTTNGTNVILTTNPQAEGKTYTLTADGVSDLEGNAIAQTTVSFTACNAIEIVAQPASMTALENCPVTFSVMVSGSAPVFYEWHKDGMAIPGANQSSIVTPPVALSDSGSLYWVVVSNDCGAVTSDAATLTVSADVVPPIPQRAVGGPTLNTVAIYFGVAGCVAQKLEVGSAMELSNYQLSGGLVVSNAVLAPGGTNVILTTSQQMPGAEYTVFLEGVSDVAGNTIPIGSHLAFWGWAPIRVSIDRTGTNSVISWRPPIGLLEIAGNVSGPWVPMPFATSPYPIFVRAEKSFYRVVAPP